MLSERSLQEKIKAGRSKATGVRARSKAAANSRPMTAPAGILTPPYHSQEENSPSASDEVTSFDLDAPLSTPLVVDEEAAKMKAKVDGYIAKKVDAERNRRLRSNEGQMNRKQLVSLKKRLRKEAQLKFGVNTKSDSSHPAASLDDSMAPTTQRALVFDDDVQPKPEAMPLYQYNDEQCESHHLSDGAPIKFNLGGRSTASPVRTSTPDRSNGSHQASLSFNLDTSVENHAKNSDDGWWAAEEAKWKAELTARRNSDDNNASAANGFEAVSDTNDSPVGNPEEDICLRTQLVVKLPEDEGLGVQLYTPKNLHGVRLTKIVPDGPFGRTRAFEEGDVIVEINGVPLLYAGHAAVFETIRGEMLGNSEMTVTVCSPEELRKLEALVKNDPGSSEPSVAGPSSKKNPSNWLAAVGKFFKPMLDLAIPKKTDNPVGTLKGAPAWWKESRRTNKEAEPNPSGAVASETAGASPEVDIDHTTERAYLIYRADIRDLEAYKAEYMSTTSKLIAKFGGKWLARGGKITKLEGGNDDDMVLQRMVLIEFPSMEHAASFFHSEEYQEARNLRLSIATAELTVLEGMAPM